MQNRYSYVLAISLAVILSLSFYTSNPAFADLSVTTITPVNSTYGTLTATSDCSDITSGNGIVWVGCNNVIYAINDVTNTIVGNISATTGTNNAMLASVSGTSLYHEVANTDTKKYTLSGNTITLSGIHDPSGCDPDGFTMIYDELGYIWNTCAGVDRILRINPATFTTDTFSQDLTDGIGLECGDPDAVAYSALDNIGVLHCDTNNVYMTFSRSSPTSITLLDDIAGSAGEFGIFIHERYNRFYVNDNTGILSYSYDGSGIISVFQSVIGSADYQKCHIEPYASSDVFLFCTTVSGGIISIDGFFSNSTSFVQVSNNVVAHSGTTVTNIGLDIQDEVFYVSGNNNNQNYIKVAGVSTLREGTDPEPPTGGTGGGSNASNGVCGNTDTNGDGRVNVLDCAGTNTPWDGITGGVPPVQIVGSVTDGLGLTDCEADGSDQDTCGSGLFFFILTLILLEFLVLAGYLGLTKATHADKQVIDVLLLMLIVGFATVALGFYLDWIPDLVFYTIIALIAGFLVFGLVSKLRGG